MCALRSKFNHSFKWVAYLMVVAGAYTFLHWFLAVPLLYSHLYKCCNQKFPKNWIMWFLAVSFACWLGVAILMVLIWTCLSMCKTGKHLNESKVRQIERSEGDKTESSETVCYEKNGDGLCKSSESVTESGKEAVALPDLRPTDNLTVLKVNDPQPRESPVSRLDFAIPVDESRHYIQSECSEKDGSGTPLKTPREIFFKDLIEAASNSPSYFDFDPEKISRDLKKKYELEKLKADNGKMTEDEKNFFVGSHSGKQNLTSEVLITLNEKGLMAEDPVVLGRFHVLKE